MTATIRRADAGDIPHLAHVFMEAWGGLCEALYEEVIPNRPTNQIIEHLLSRGNATTCVKNCWVAELEDKIAGGVHTFPADDEADDPPDPLVPKERLGILEPFFRLHVEGSYYIASLTVFPEFRGRGLGRLLMAEVEADARVRKFGQASLTVFAENKGALTLYEDLGYREIARQPAVPHPRLIYDGDIVAMTKEL